MIPGGDDLPEKILHGMEWTGILIVGMSQYGILTQQAKVLKMYGNWLNQEPLDRRMMWRDAPYYFIIYVVEARTRVVKKSALWKHMKVSMGSATLVRVNCLQQTGGQLPGTVSFPVPLMLWIASYLARAVREAALINWLPLSEWRIVLRTPQHLQAFSKARPHSSARILSSIASPTISPSKQSKTGATYSFPSEQGTSVISVSHLRPGASTVKFLAISFSDFWADASSFVMPFEWRFAFCSRWMRRAP